MAQETDSLEEDRGTIVVARKQEKPFFKVWYEYTAVRDSLRPLRGATLVLPHRYYPSSQSLAEYFYSHSQTKYSMADTPALDTVHIRLLIGNDRQASIRDVALRTDTAANGHLLTKELARLAMAAFGDLPFSRWGRAGRIYRNTFFRVKPARISYYCDLYIVTASFPLTYLQQYDQLGFTTIYEERILSGSRRR